MDEEAISTFINRYNGASIKPPSVVAERTKGGYKL